MTTENRLQAEGECARLCVAFAHAVDSADADALAALFITDGVFERRDLTLQGSDAIRDFIRKRPAERVTRHVCSNILIEITGPGTATGRSLFTLFDGVSADEGPAQIHGPSTLGEYHDQFVRTADGWRFSRRLGKAVFRLGGTTK